MFLTTKPNFQSYFILPTIVTSLIVLFVLSLLVSVGYLFSHRVSIIPYVLAIVVLLISFLYITRLYVSYTKTSYECDDTKILLKTGGLFSNFQTELLYKNVTMVSRVRPFLSHKFFRTEHIVLESSGSSKMSAPLVHIDSSLDLFDSVLMRLEENSVSVLSKRNHVQTFVPQTRDIILEFIWNILSFIGFSFLFLFSAASDIRSLVDTLLADNTHTPIVLGIGAFLLSIFAFYYFSKLVIRFLDKKVRTYEFYTNKVVFHNGFLTTQYVVLPLQNIANTAKNQSLLQRLFGTENMIVSVQGSGSEVVFSHLDAHLNAHGVLEKLLRDSKNKHEFHQTQARAHIASQKASKRTKEPVHLDDVVSQTQDDIHITHKQSSEHKSFVMHRPRLAVSFVFKVIGLLVLSVLLFFVNPAFSFILIFSIFSLSYQFVRDLRTTYAFTDKGIMCRIDLFSVESVEYTYDKIVLIENSRSILDSVFGTNTFKLKSIGTNVPLVLKHMSRDLDIESTLFEHVKIPLLVKTKEVPLGIMQVIYALFWTLILLIFVGIGSLITLYLSQIGLFSIPQSVAVLLSFLPIALLIVMCLLVIGTFLRYARATLDYSHIHMTYCYGLFRKCRVTTKFEHVKIVTLKSHKYVNFERVILTIAGEELSGSDNNRSIMPNFVQVYANHSQVIDLFTETKLADDTLHIAKPTLRKAKIFTALTAIFFIPLFFTIPYLIWLRSNTYELHSSKIVKRSGIFTHSVSVLGMHKIDYIDLSQTFSDRVCGAKHILIYTPGTSKYDMALGPLLVHTGEEVYNIIKEQYTLGASRKSKTHQKKGVR
jgi:uncharacterized membrane protein YdbT with pleckstrin-like domain